MAAEGLTPGSSRDRRRFPRMRTAWPVLLEAADGRVGVGQVVDVSLSGIAYQHHLDVEPDTRSSWITLPKDTGRLRSS